MPKFIIKNVNDSWLQCHCRFRKSTYNDSLTFFKQHMMDQVANLTNIIDDLQEKYLLSDEEVARMLVGGSLVAAVILGIAYIIYVTNFTVVAQYVFNKLLSFMIPRVSRESIFTSLVVYVQVLIFIGSCLFFRRVKTIHVLDNYGPSISSGQVYRFFTSALVHSDVFSLCNNAKAIGSLGGLLERSIGIRVLIIFALSNTLHAVAVFLLNPLSHSFGASGVIFGFMGALMYINFFRSSLFSKSGRGQHESTPNNTSAWQEKQQASEKFRDESVFFVVRYMLIGVLLDRMDLLSSLCSLVVGFLTCMTVCGDLSIRRTRIVVAVYLAITSLLIGYTQLHTIHNLDLDLRRIDNCYRLSSAKRFVPFQNIQLMCQIVLHFLLIIL